MQNKPDTITHDALIELDESVLFDFIYDVNDNLAHLELKDAGIVVDYDEEGHKLQLMIFKGDCDEVCDIYSDGSPYPEEKMAARMTLTPSFLEYDAERSLQTFAGDWHNPPEYDEVNCGDKDISVIHDIDDHSFDGNPMYKKVLTNIAEILAKKEVFLLTVYTATDDYRLSISSNGKSERHESYNDDCKKITSALNDYINSLSEPKIPSKDEEIALIA